MGDLLMKMKGLRWNRNTGEISAHKDENAIFRNPEPYSFHCGPVEKEVFMSFARALHIGGATMRV